MTFKEQITNLKNRINGFITKDSTAEQIKAFQELGAEVDELEAEHDKAETEIKGLKEIIVSQVKDSGTKKSPEDDTKPDNRSLDNIIKQAGDDVIAKRSKE